MLRQHDAAADAGKHLSDGIHVGIGFPVCPPEVLLVNQVSVAENNQTTMLACGLHILERFDRVCSCRCRRSNGFPKPGSTSASRPARREAESRGRRPQQCALPGSEAVQQQEAKAASYVSSSSCLPCLSPAIPAAVPRKNIMAHGWRSLSAQSLVVTKFSRLWAREEWARSIEPGTRAWEETSPSRFYPRIFPPIPRQRGALNRKPRLSPP